MSYGNAGKKHRLVEEEEEVTRIDTSKYYIISEHGKRVIVVNRIISGLATSCYATKYQFNSFILLLSTGSAGNARTHAHKTQTHTHRKRETNQVTISRSFLCAAAPFISIAILRPTPIVWP
jgi:hypothetical protein